MKYQIRRWEPSKEEVLALDSVCFPEDEPWWHARALWWAAFTPSGEVAAYAALLRWEPDNSGFLARAGTLPEHRRQGLQLRLIRARIAAARRLGLAAVYTYTVPWGVTSARNLIRAGLLPWSPGRYWAGVGQCYWALRL